MAEIVWGVEDCLQNRVYLAEIVGWADTQILTFHLMCMSSEHPLYLYVGKTSGVPRIAALFMKANRNWLSEQIEIMSDHFNSE